MYCPRHRHDVSGAAEAKPSCIRPTNRMHKSRRDASVANPHERRPALRGQVNPPAINFDLDMYSQNSKLKVLTGRGLPRRDLSSAARCPRLRFAVAAQKSAPNAENLFVICGEISASSFNRARREIPSNPTVFKIESMKLTKSIGNPAFENDDAIHLTHT